MPKQAMGFIFFGYRIFMCFTYSWSGYVLNVIGETTILGCRANLKTR